MRTVTRNLMVALVGVCLGAIVWFGLLRPASGAARQGSQRPLLTKLPPIKNCVEHVKLVKAELIMQGENQAAKLEIENTAYIGVVAITVEQMANRTKESVDKTGFTADKPPAVVIEPGKTVTLELGNLDANAPIRIGAAIFSDGTEEGCEGALKSIHLTKDFQTKGGPPQ